MGKVFQNKGYATACLGKWHLGFGEEENDWQVPLEPGPNEVGFDYYWGIPFVNSGSPFVYVENKTVVGHDPNDPLIYLGRNNEQNLEPSPTPTFPKEASIKSPNRFAGALKAHQLYDDEKTGTYLTDKAVNWITENKENPFFLYFATTNIHHPFTPAPRFKGTSQAGLYGDYIHELDWMVGEIVKSLEENGLTENTMIIVTSDNGGMLNLGGRIAVEQGHKINGDLLGFKFGAWEGGHRVPFIAKWPGKIPVNSKSDRLISQVDLLATFASIINQPLSPDREHDSIDQLSELTGRAESPQREVLVISPNSPEHLVIRKGKWVYIPDQDAGGFQGKKIGDHTLGGAAAFALTQQKNSDVVNGKIRDDAPTEQLYDLEVDPQQSENVVTQNPKVKKELQQILADYRNKIGPYPKLGWINIEAVAARERRKLEKQKEK